MTLELDRLHPDSRSASPFLETPGAPASEPARGPARPQHHGAPLGAREEGGSDAPVSPTAGMCWAPTRPASFLPPRRARFWTGCVCSPVLGSDEEAPGTGSFLPTSPAPAQETGLTPGSSNRRTPYCDLGRQPLFRNIFRNPCALEQGLQGVRPKASDFLWVRLPGRPVKPVTGSHSRQRSGQRPAATGTRVCTSQHTWPACARACALTRPPGCLCRGPTASQPSLNLDPHQLPGGRGGRALRRRAPLRPPNTLVGPRLPRGRGAEWTFSRPSPTRTGVSG